MRFFVVEDDEIILGIGKGGSAGSEISEERYQEILSAIRAKPKATETTDYRLRDDLTWEAYEVEPPEPEEDELTDEEALEIILGGAV